MEFRDGKWRWSEEEKQHKREVNQNLIWITNGIDSKKHPKDQLIPEGWKLGRAENDKRGLIQGVSENNHSPEANRKRSEKLLGRPSPNRGHVSPKRGLTEVEYYGEEKAQELFESRSLIHAGKTPWNLGVARTPEEKDNISEAKSCLSPEIKSLHEAKRAKELAEYSTRRAKWSKDVRELDRYTCQHCGFQKEKGLNAHHIKDWDNFIELRYVLENGLTLCNHCHRILETTLKILKVNRYQFNKWEKLETVFVDETSEVCLTCHRLTSTQLENVKVCSCQH